MGIDVLSESLRRVRLGNQVYGRLELTAPWGMRVDIPSKLSFLAVARGSCLLQTKERRLTLAAGDLVLLRAGLTHTIKDRPTSRAASVAEVYAQRGGRCGGVVRYGGGGAPTTLLSVAFELETTHLDPLRTGLPEVLYVPGDDGGLTTRWLESTLQIMASEMSAQEPGYELVASRLADVLFVKALRSHARTTTCELGGWLRGLSDPELGAVFQRMHEQLDEPWTVATLARVARMSRSAFASRFTSMLGMAPLTYLTRLRMHRAAEMLATEQRSTTEIAAAVGYETDSAFVKAFKRHIGETPGAYGRRMRREREQRATPKATSAGHATSERRRA